MVFISVLTGGQQAISTHRFNLEFMYTEIKCVRTFENDSIFMFRVEQPKAEMKMKINNKTNK